MYRILDHLGELADMGKAWVTKLVHYIEKGQVGAIHCKRNLIDKGVK